MTMFTASMIIQKDQQLTLDDLRLFHGVTDGFPDSSELEVREDGVYITWDDGKDIIRKDEGEVEISEWEKELLMEHKGSGHLHFTSGPFTQNTEEVVEQMRRMKRREENLKSDSKNDLPPRDELGRFVKRKPHYSDYLTDD